MEVKFNHSHLAGGLLLVENKDRKEWEIFEIEFAGNMTRWLEWQLQIGFTRKVAEFWGRASHTRREIGLETNKKNKHRGQRIRYIGLINPLTLLKLRVSCLLFLSKYIINRLLRSYVINNYDAHFREIFLAILNEYSNWDQVKSVNR